MVIKLTDEAKEMISYWKEGYHKLYERYAFGLRNENHLMDQKVVLENKIEHLNNQIDLLVIEKMELKNEIITLKRLIDEAHMNSTTGNY